MTVAGAAVDATEVAVVLSILAPTNPVRTGLISLIRNYQNSVAILERFNPKRWFLKQTAFMTCIMGF